MTLRDVMNDKSVIPGTVAHSRAERLLRRSRQPLQRRLWRRISGRATASRSRSGQSRQVGGSSALSRVESLEAGVRRLLNATVDDDDFVLIVESTDAAYVSSRRPGCSLSVAHQSSPVAQFRFVVVNSSSSSWQRGLLQRLDSAVAALHQATVIKRLYYKWWTSTDCLAQLINPNVWTLSVGRDATDVDETSDDERIFFQSPVSAAAAEPHPSFTTRNRTRRIDDDELDRGEMSMPQLDELSDVTQSPARDLLDVTTTIGSRDITADNRSHQRHSQSVLVSSTSTTTTPSRSTTTTTTTTELARRSHRKPDDDDSKRRPSTVDNGLRNYDDLHVRATIKDTAEQDRFDYVFKARDTLTRHGQVDYDGLSFDDDNSKNSDRLIGEQEMAVKEHWRSGGGTAVAGEAIQSTWTTRTRTSDSGQWSAVTGGGSVDECSVVSPASVTLLLVITSLLVLLTSTVTTQLYYSQ